MSFKKSMVALAAISYGFGSVAASAAPADRAVEPVADASQFSSNSDSSGTIMLVLALAAIIAGIVIAASGDDDDPTLPVSP